MAIEVGQFFGIYDGSRGPVALTVGQRSGSILESFVGVHSVDTGVRHTQGEGVNRRFAFALALGQNEGRIALERLQSFENAIDSVEYEARLRDNIVVEGPPIYLWPRPENPAENIVNIPSANGWILTDAILKRLAVRNPKHFMLVDDYNNRPEEIEDADISAGVASIIQHSAILRELPALRPQGTSAAFSESSFVNADDESKNKCHFLDGAFQMRKLSQLVSEGMTPQEMVAVLKASLIVVVHPEEFMGQQSAMLSALMGVMKDSSFSSIPKMDRREIISDMYTHVWLDRSGRVSSVTKPRWDGNKFMHQEVEHAN